MNKEAPTFPAPMPAAARGQGEVLDDFEAGVARSLGEGSRLARLLMQLLVMLREALARFAIGLAVDTAMADVAAIPAASLAGVLDVARPMRARRVRAASARPAARGVVVAAGRAAVVPPVAAIPGWARMRDGFSLEWVGFERVRFSKSVCRSAQTCVQFVTISKQTSTDQAFLVLFLPGKDCWLSR
jgi:hypothetical protein